MDYNLIKQEAENRILHIRGKEVMLDADVAELYDVKTGELNRKVKNNIDRFPNDVYMFTLTDEEKKKLVQSHERIAQKLKFSHYNPKVFTEYGVIMISTVLNSQIAIQICHVLVDTFIYLKKNQKTIDQFKAETAKLQSEVTNLKNILAQQAQQNQEYDSHFQVVFKELVELKKHIQSNADNKKIGF